MFDRIGSRMPGIKSNVIETMLSRRERGRGEVVEEGRGPVWQGRKERKCPDPDQYHHTNQQEYQMGI